MPDSCTACIFHNEAVKCYNINLLDVRFQRASLDTVSLLLLSVLNHTAFTCLQCNVYNKRTFVSIVAKEMHYNIGNVGLGTISYLVKKLNLNFSNSFLAMLIFH